MRFQWTLLSAGVVLALGSIMQGQPQLDQGHAAEGSPALDTVRHWQQCHEYLPGKYEQCRIDFDMRQTADGKNPPQTHKDISVWPGRNGRAVVVLWNSSPFVAYSLTTNPGPLGRDPSANVSSLLATLGTGGAVAAALGSPPPVPVGNELSANVAEFAEIEGPQSQRLLQ